MIHVSGESNSTERVTIGSGNVLKFVPFTAAVCKGCGANLFAKSGEKNLLDSVRREVVDLSPTR